MTILSERSDHPFVPYAPPPRERRPNPWLHLWLLARNPLETWRIAHYEESILLERSWFGSSAVVSDPVAIRRVFVENAENYPKDELQLRLLRPRIGDGLLTAAGDAWKHARRTLSPLFTPKRVAAAAAVMRARAERCVDRWLSGSTGAVIALDREMTALTFDILSATMFSNAIGADYDAFEKAMTRYFNTIGRVDPLDVLGMPDWVPRIGRLVAEPAMAYFEGAVARLIAERGVVIEQDPAAAPDDILTALLRASDPETGVGLTEAEVAANLITFIAAGHETTARALTWTLHLLAHAPAVRAQAEDEASGAGDDPADWLDSLPTIRAALEESMRLFPPAPFLSRVAREDDTLAGVSISANTLVIVAPWLVHRHRRLWEAPDAFMPSRFMPGARETIDRFAYLPFGAGPRICIGARFAMMEAVIALTTILRRVRLDPSEAGEPRPVQRITLRPAERLMMTVGSRDGRSTVATVRAPFNASTVR